MLKELSTTIATDLTSWEPALEKENIAGFENTITISTKIKDLTISKSTSFIFDLFATSPCEERRKDTAEKLFLTPLFLDIRCAITGNAPAASPVKKKGFKKEKFTYSPYLTAI
jgi:hypothetical protein